MKHFSPPATLRHTLPWLAIAFLLANFVHFAHNAEYLPFYPGMPAWLTREQVYLVWLAGASLFAGAIALYCRRHLKAAVILLGAYGSTGLDGLLHYTLALCSEHTFATNITIWSEVTLGLCLLLACAVTLFRMASRPESAHLAG